MTEPIDYRPLVESFGEEVRRDEPLSRYTVARLGGPADVLIETRTTEMLVRAASLCWENDIPARVIGGGANVLFSDSGYRGAILVNSARRLSFDGESGEVRAESGVGLAYLARESVARGLAGFEWAISVPGTLGGGIVNNAGAHGSDIAASLRTIAILLENGQFYWPVERLDYRYRESSLKRASFCYVVLAAELRLSPGNDPAALRARADEFIAHRKRTQPPGASLGSMFKNPPGDYAGRLIEAAGLKGTGVGGVMISPVHANFFVNRGGGTAGDYLELIRLARETVRQRFGITLELEIEIVPESG